MQKKTTDTLTMTSNDRHTVTQTDFMDGLIRLDQQCNRTRTTDREEKRKSPRFAFLKISASAHCTHPANPSEPTLQAKVCGKSAILPTHPKRTNEMTDVHDKKTRSYNMSQIRAKNTKPEMTVRKYLFGQGFRYRLHEKKLPGKPDIVLPKYNVVIFVHGCFWHGHDGCKYFVMPKTRTEWWLNKINRNKKLDSENLKKLKAEGWKVISIFECDLKNGKTERTLKNIVKQLEANGNTNN